MGEEFEEYLRENRGRIEKGGPSPKVWENIEQVLIARQKKKAQVIRLRLVSWSVAAGLVLGIGVASLFRPANKPLIQVVKDQPKVQKSAPAALPVKKDTLYAQNPAIAPLKTHSANKIIAAKPKSDESISYYASLVAQREQELKQLQALDPGLYKESQKAIAELNATYNQLQKQLNGNIGREKVVEMMILNLQMQEKILSNQLQLIHDAEQKDEGDDQTL